MGRRAIPKVDDALDISNFLTRLDSSGERLDVHEWFQRAAPLEIEIGSGKGLFLINAATANPDRDYLGVEIVGKYARLTAARLARKELRNACIVQGDGQALLQSLPNDSVAALHVYFPDPWWKKRHRKRRVLNESFFSAADRILIPQGRLHFWTDVKEYFDSTLDLMTTASRLAGPLEVEATPALHNMDYRTHFERRVRMNGLPVYRAEFYKPGWRVEFAVDSRGVLDVSADPAEKPAGNDRRPADS